MINNGRSRKLPFDPDEAIRHLKAADPKLGALIDRAGPFALRLDPAPSPSNRCSSQSSTSSCTARPQPPSTLACASILVAIPLRNSCSTLPTSRSGPLGFLATRSRRSGIWLPAPSTAPSLPTLRFAKCQTLTSLSASHRSAASAPGPWKCSYLPHGPPRRAAGNRLRRAQGLCPHISATTQVAPARIQ